MADFSFTVDTSPMASEIRSVTKNVGAVSGAVVAMSAAVVAAEKEGAERICENVNRGFYTMMQSQITQKIAQLTSTVESKLMELGQYAAALQAIQTRMQGDYNMISARYSKLFNSLNIALETRVAELDMPAFKLVQRDMRLIDNRMRMNYAQFATNQVESVLSSQMLLSSKVKVDADNAIGAMKKYVKETHEEQRKTNVSMEDKYIDESQTIYIPVSIVESANPVGSNSVNYYVARSGNEEIDRSIDQSVREHSYNSAIKGNWSEIDGDEMGNVEAEFVNLFMNIEGDERVRNEIIRMFNETQDVQQLNP